MPVSSEGNVVEPPAAATPDAILRQVAGWMLPGVPSPTAPSPESADLLVGLAITEGVLGPLVACVDAGVLDLPEPARQRAVDAHEGSLWWCLLVEQRLLDIDRWFANAGGIDYLVVKGSAVAHLDEIDSSLRSYGDLDLLIAGHHMDRALDVLIENGAVRRIPARRPGFDARYGKGVGTRFPDGIEVDVHRSYCGGAHGFRIPLDRIFATPDRFHIGGQPILAPSRVHRALHACYHAVVGSGYPPLRTLRDLGWYLSDGDLSPDVLVAEARLWRGEAVLAEAVQATIDTFDLTLPRWQNWLDTRSVDPAEHQLLEQDRSHSNKLFHWSTIRELGWRDRAAYLWAVAVPSREVLDDRGQTPWTRIKTGVRRLLADR